MMGEEGQFVKKVIPMSPLHATLAIRLQAIHFLGISSLSILQAK
jgi:hypothetical protein